MFTLPSMSYVATDLADLPLRPGALAVLVGPGGTLDTAGRKLGQGLRRLVDSPRFEALPEGGVLALDFPPEVSAERILVAKLSRDAAADPARRAGAAIAALWQDGPLTICAGGLKRPEDLALGLALKSYRFDHYKRDATEARGPVTLLCDDPERAARAASRAMAQAEGVCFARDLVNEPANVLTCTEFAARLAAMRDLGLEVDILDEAALSALGMGLLLSVAQGSASPARVVVMRWRGSDAAPVALIGKGVVFDSGGISIKGRAGMEEMTADMGGAGTVAGVMRCLALRRAQAHVVGIVGLVENMPSGTATRPGDIVRSMQGDRVEIVNTDAEGRLVLADLLTYAQQHFAPDVMVDLATLTGAIKVALGAEHAGAFCNDDALAREVEHAADTAGEALWRMPLAPGHVARLASRKADLKNSGPREGGACIAAGFLEHFVAPGQPWMHLDIAGVANVMEDTTFAPKGATGWGVRALDTWIGGRG